MSNDGTERLRENLLCQQERLLQQLDDLEAVKDELDAAEYDEVRGETMEQIIDVAAGLDKLVSGNLSLTDQLGSQRQLTREAISAAFRTPEVLRMFAKREPEQLRQRLAERERDFKLGKLTATAFNQDKKELLVALRQLGETLTGDQTKFLSEDQVDRADHFIAARESPDEGTVLNLAKQLGADGK